MGLKRITARIEVTYPADDPRTLAELVAATPDNIRSGLTGGTGGVLASYGPLNAAVDPDAEPSLPDAPSGPEVLRKR